MALVSKPSPVVRTLRIVAVSGLTIFLFLFGLAVVVLATTE